MMNPALWEPFEAWLNERVSGDDIRPMEERGLKPEAPPEAVEAYEKYCAIADDLDRRGIMA